MLVDWRMNSGRLVIMISQSTVSRAPFAHAARLLSNSQQTGEKEGEQNPTETPTWHERNLARRRPSEGGNTGAL
jgi:hypothetical protein